MPEPRPYRTPDEAVAAEVARMALATRLAWWRLVGDSRHYATPRDADEVDAELVRLELPRARLPPTVDPQIDALAARLEARVRDDAADRAATETEMPLHALARRAGLDGLGFDLFVLALAPEVDDGFGRVFTYLRGGGSTRRALDVATAGRILATRTAGAAPIRAALAPGSPLVDLGLVELLAPDGSAAVEVAMTTLLAVPAPVVAWVLGRPVRDARLRAFVSPAPPSLGRARSFVPDEAWQHADAILRATETERSAVLLVEGPPGAGQRELARGLCDEHGVRLVEVDVARAPERMSPSEVQGVIREAWLAGAALLVVVPGPDDNAPPGTEPAWARGVASLVARHPGPVMLAREVAEVPYPTAIAAGRRLSVVRLPAPDPATREKLWRDRLGDAPDVDYGKLAHNYPLTGGTITRIADEARVRASARGVEARQPTHPDVLASIEAEFAPRLATVGRRLRTRARFEDMVLPSEVRESLAEFAATVRLRHQVLDEWRFERLVRGRGVSALFYGEPGTGKTLSAGVIAESVGLPLYQIDTASVLSKWVGETEKNLAEVFRAAEAGHAMLLFDEADAMFGKRTDVQNSTDRYANMQTNFLLTQIEMFNGVTVLTTNRESVMDLAFQRRLSFRVYFPMPEVDEREDLWRRMLDGQGAPRGDVDVKALARKLVMSGGYIRNAVLRGAYLAAATNKPLSTEILHHAATLVLRDAGKVI